MEKIYEEYYNEIYRFRLHIDEVDDNIIVQANFAKKDDESVTIEITITDDDVIVKFSMEELTKYICLSSCSVNIVREVVDCWKVTNGNRKQFTSCLVSRV